MTRVNACRAFFLLSAAASALAAHATDAQPPPTLEMLEHLGEWTDTTGAEVELELLLESDAAPAPSSPADLSND